MKQRSLVELRAGRIVDGKNALPHQLRHVRLAQTIGRNARRTGHLTPDLDEVGLAAPGGPTMANA